MVRSNDVNLPANIEWLSAPETKVLCAALTAQDDPVFFVGGCVRDALLGVTGGDVDLSTAALPEHVMQLAETAGLKAVPTGIDHGTVTVVSGGKGFEVTTFRRDVETDGRRAVVSFSTDIAEDARRRDFTLNALYATPEGRVVDPLGGLDDCLNCRIRFIEDADARIREDYLRILRYFRFHAWYADEVFEADTLDAIARNIDGLETLSAERVGSELMKLLAAPDPAPAVAAMRQTGSLACVLPGSDDRFLAPLVHVEQLVGATADPIRRLAVLGGHDVAASLRLSRARTRDLGRIKAALESGKPLAEVAYRQSGEIARDVAFVRAAIAGQPVDEADLLSIEEASAAQFPISAADLMSAYEGPALGARLAELEAMWIASGFTLSREDLMTAD